MFGKLALPLCLAAALPLTHPLMAQDHAVLYNSGSSSWTDLGALPGYSAPSGPFWQDPTGTVYSAGGAYGISDAGTIVLTAGDYLACTYSGGTVSTVPGLLAAPNTSEALGISPDGSKIVGYARATRGDVPARPFLYDGSIHYLTTAQQGGALAVNNAGSAAGWFGSVVVHAFSYASSTLTDITPSAVTGRAWAINSGGLVAGVYTPCVGQPRHLFSYNGTLSDLGTGQSGCGYVDSRMGVSDSNVIVGTLIAFVNGSCGPQEAFYYDGSVHAISFDSQSFARAITGSVVVGWGTPSNHPFKYTIGGSVTDLGVAKTGGGNWSAVQATGINASGQIVGVATP